MRHLKRTAKLGRTSEHRNAMLANLVCSLIEHKRVTTTLAKAYEAIVDRETRSGKAWAFALSTSRSHRTESNALRMSSKAAAVAKHGEPGARRAKKRKE